MVIQKTNQHSVIQKTRESIHAIKKKRQKRKWEQKERMMSLLGSAKKTQQLQGSSVR
jgi:hypothetical protein